MDPQEAARAQLEAYRARNPDEVTPEMMTRWEEWMDAAWKAVQNVRGQKTFLEEDPALERWRLSRKYLRGTGIEIGALHNPLRLDQSVKVRYVDKRADEDLALLYYEVAGYRFVDVDIVDDGEVLGTIPDESQNFVISNHFLEHCQNPVGALAAHVRVLRPGGVLYCAVPDCRKTFDSKREITSFEHVWRDYAEGPGWSRRAHYQDWSIKVNERTGEEHEAWWRLLDALDYSIHFHVWTPWDVLELISSVRRRLALALDIVAFVAHWNECVVIARKR